MKSVPIKVLEPVCRNCVYFDASFCKRYAPKYRDESGEAKWPRTGYFNWCGEFRERYDRLGEHGIYPNGADLTVKRSSGRSFEKMTLILKRIKKK